MCIGCLCLITSPDWRELSANRFPRPPWEGPTLLRIPLPLLPALGLSGHRRFPEAGWCLGVFTPDGRGAWTPGCLVASVSQ